jgi:hypothetical protein
MIFLVGLGCFQEIWFFLFGHLGAELLRYQDYFKRLLATIADGFFGFSSLRCDSSLFQRSNSSKCPPKPSLPILSGAMRRGCAYNPTNGGSGLLKNFIVVRFSNRLP